MLQPAELDRLSETLVELERTAQDLADYLEPLSASLGLGTECSTSTCNSLKSILDSIAEIPAETADLAAAIGTKNAQRANAASEVGLAWLKKKQDNAETFVETAWDVQPLPLRDLLSGGLSFFGRFRGSYRQASKVLATLIKVPLPKGARNRIALVDRLAEVERARTELSAEDTSMMALLPLYWRGPKTDFELLHSVSSSLCALAAIPFRRISKV